LTVLESRALFEFGAFLASAPLLRLAGRGDRHPVLVLPGFTADDRSTMPLRAILRGQGYWVHGWSLGANWGPTDRVLDGLDRRLEDVFGRHGRRVSLIGWSLGGMLAREMARAHPDAVRQVITLASPFRMVPTDRSAASMLSDRVAHRYSARWPAVEESAKPPLQVPSTAVYTRTDGVCRWHTCIDVESPRHENVEVRGSHSGLGYNPAVIIVVSDRLAQPEGQWRPFRPPLGTGALFPPPASWRPSVS
jgi:pimeloyl-ACP methyl ester carboxylesterase